MTANKWVSFAMAPVFLGTAFAAAAEKPFAPPPQDSNFWNRFEFYNNDDKEAEAQVRTYKGDEIHTTNIVSTYRGMMREDGTPFAQDAELIIPLLLHNLEVGPEYMIVQQYACFKKDNAEAMKPVSAQTTEDLSVGLQVKKYFDNSVEITFTKGPYTGVNFLYSRSDRAGFINYYQLRANDGKAYNFPNLSFVSQALSSQRGSVADIGFDAQDRKELNAANQEEEVVLSFEDLGSFKISGDIDQGYAVLKAPDGSLLSLNLKQGSMHTKGTVFGLNVTLDFKPSDEIIATHVYKLATEFPFESFEKGTFENAADCEESEIPVLPKADPKQHMTLGFDKGVFPDLTL